MIIAHFFKKNFIILFLFFCIQSKAQSNWQQFKKLSCPKKVWVIFHICKAKKAYKVSKEAQYIADSVANTSLLDGDKNGGQVDAFRHAYWMARLHEEIGKNAAISLGKAHEKENYIQYKKNKLEDGSLPDKASKTMDLFNNAAGISFTQKGKQLPKKDLIFKIVDAIKAGELKIIKKDMKGNYLTCNGKMILKEQLKGKWENNKCLISSKKINQ